MSTSPLRFEIHPSSGVPIYRQIIDQVQMLIASGQMPPGSLLPSVRDLASSLQVNFMTISKAYARLEADGLLTRVRGKGMEVAAALPTASAPERLRSLRPVAELMVTRGQQLGLTADDMSGLIHNIVQERQP